MHKYMNENTAESTQYTHISMSRLCVHWGVVRGSGEGCEYLHEGVE